MRTLTAAILVILSLGLVGCASKPEAAPQELPLLTGTLEGSAAPSEWTTPPSEPPPPSDHGTQSSAVQTPGPKAPGTTIESTVRRLSKAAAVATVVIDRETNTSLIAENADRGFYAGSLVKLLIALDALQRHPNSSTTRRQVTTMIQYSDDPLASSFWMSEGGADIVLRMRTRLSLVTTRPPETPGQWGNTVISANDLARIYNYLLVKAAPADRETIIDAMANAAPRGSDGFAQHFGIPSTMDPWAVKQAWTNTTTDKSVHSTGLVGDKWRYVVIVLTKHSASVSWDVATRSVTEAARAIAPLVS